MSKAVERSQSRHPRNGRPRDPGYVAHHATTAKDAGIGADRADEATQCDELPEEFRVHLPTIRWLKGPFTSPKGLGHAT